MWNRRRPPGACRGSGQPELSVDVGDYEVEDGFNGNKVGYHEAARTLVNGTHEVEAGALEVHAVRSLASVAFDVDAECAARCLHLLIPVANGELDEFGNLS